MLVAHYGSRTAAAEPNTPTALVSGALAHSANRWAKLHVWQGYQLLCRRFRIARLALVACGGLVKFKWATV